jgi:hypothetical protein
MSTPLWAIEAAEGFWQAAGEPGPFPRDLRRPIALSLPLALVALPGLRVSSVDRWLRRVGISCSLAVTDRPLRACLIARRGQGLLFLDGTDPADEARFSLAHELAHYLRHYRRPRQTAVDRLGPEILQVLDEERPARADERGHALLAGIRIGYHVHLMAAYELLAPSAAVLAEVEQFPAEVRRDRVAFLLRTGYGFPAGAARRYAGRLAPAPRRADSFLQRLRSG